MCVLEPFTVVHCDWRKKKTTKPYDHMPDVTNRHVSSCACVSLLHVCPVIVSSQSVLQQNVIENIQCKRRIAIGLKRICLCVCVCLSVCPSVLVCLALDLIPVWEVAYDNDTLQLCEAGERWAFPRLYGQQGGHPLVYWDGKVKFLHPSQFTLYKCLKKKKRTKKDSQKKHVVQFLFNFTLSNWILRLFVLLKV